MENYSITKHEAKYEFYKGAFTCADFSYAYFASDHIMQNILLIIPEEQRMFYMDATFKICPLGQFYQLLVIYIGYCRQIIPFIYVLMSRKSEKSYTHIFQTLKKLFPLGGKSIIMDFELAMRNALKNIYPNTELNTCWFHFCQAAKRRARKLPNFVNAVATNEEARSAYYKLLALPLLPAKDIIPTFGLVKTQVEQNKAVTEFFNYFEKQWIIKVN